MAAKDSQVQRLQADPIDPLDPGSYASFLRMTAGVFDISTAPDEIDCFGGCGFTAHASRRFVLTEAGLPRLRFRRSPEIIMRSRLEHFVIRLSISGTSAGLAGYNKVEAQAGDLMFIDLSQTLNLQTSMARTGIGCLAVDPAGARSCGFPRRERASRPRHQGFLSRRRNYRNHPSIAARTCRGHDPC